jgi:hypothetical protein
MVFDDYLDSLRDTTLIGNAAADVDVYLLGFAIAVVVSPVAILDESALLQSLDHVFVRRFVVVKGKPLTIEHLLYQLTNI